MATLHLLRPLLSRPQVLGLGLGLSLATYQTIHSRPLLMDTIPSNPRASSSSFQTSNSRLSTPALQLNESTIRQFSSGSIIGLCAGLLVSTFSRSLALILGLLVVGVQYASSKGINLIPYERLQRYVHGIDLRSAVQENVAFKLSFGMAFALAGFCKF